MNNKTQEETFQILYNHRKIKHTQCDINYSHQLDHLRANKINKSSFHWLKKENQRYLIFISCNCIRQYFVNAYCGGHYFVNDIVIFQQMSNFIKTRSPQECQKHHTYLMQKFKSLDQIIKLLSKNINLQTDNLAFYKNVQKLQKYLIQNKFCYYQFYKSSLKQQKILTYQIIDMNEAYQKSIILKNNVKGQKKQSQLQEKQSQPSEKQSKIDQLNKQIQFDQSFGEYNDYLDLDIQILLEVNLQFKQMPAISVEQSRQQDVNKQFQSNKDKVIHKKIIWNQEQVKKMVAFISYNKQKMRLNIQDPKREFFKQMAYFIGQCSDNQNCYDKFNKMYKKFACLGKPNICQIIEQMKIYYGITDQDMEKQYVSLQQFYKYYQQILSIKANVNEQLQINMELFKTPFQIPKQHIVVQNKQNTIELKINTFMPFIFQFTQDRKPKR